MYNQFLNKIDLDTSRDSMGQVLRHTMLLLYCPNKDIHQHHLFDSSKLREVLRWLWSLDTKYHHMFDLHTKCRDCVLDRQRHTLLL